MDLSSGTRVAQFSLERQIGAGGVGAVWAARDIQSGAAVALKILRPSDPSSADVLRARLLREAHATKLIDHPAIVPVLDVLDYEDSPVLVMALLEGETLRQKLVEAHKLEAVISMPSGVFKPYAGVSTAILFFTRTDSGGRP